MHDNEIERKEMHGGENEGKEMRGMKGMGKVCLKPRLISQNQYSKLANIF